MWQTYQGYRFCFVFYRGKRWMVVIEPSGLRQTVVWPSSRDLPHMVVLRTVKNWAGPGFTKRNDESSS